MACSQRSFTTKTALHMLLFLLNVMSVAAMALCSTLEGFSCPGAEVVIAPSEQAGAPPSAALSQQQRGLQLRQLAYASWWADGHPGWRIVDNSPAPQQHRRTGLLPSCKAGSTPLEAVHSFNIISIN